MNRLREIFAALAFCTAVLCHAQPLAPELARIAAMPAAPTLKQDDFSRRSPLREVVMAPDGSAIAYLNTSDSNGNSIGLHIVNVGTRASRRLLPSVGRALLAWSTDSQVVFVAMQDSVAAVNVKDGTTSTLAKMNNNLEQKFVMVDPSQPRHVLIEQFDASGYKLTRYGADGSHAVVLENSRKVSQVLMDPHGQVAFFKLRDATYQWQIMKREGSAWREATRCERRMVCNMVSTSPDLRRLYLITNPDANRSALVVVDTDSGKQRTVYADPSQVADVDAIVTAPRSGEPLYAIMSSPLLHQAGLVFSAKTAASDIDRKFPDSQVTYQPAETSPLMLLTERGTRMTHERYWLYDSARRTFDEVLQAEREASKPLPPAHAAPTLAISYRTEDGSTVYGYLTVPPGKNAATLPLLVMAHGGPWGRFNGDYNSLVQLVANRGVAVFRPNFRASPGYGLRYEATPGANFGNGLAQTDIIDGVQWLLANGVGDRKRMGFMGDSYGGYATLLALSHTPDLFQFGMALSPPTDFARLLRGFSGNFRDVPARLHFQDMGIAVDNAAAMQALEAASPASLFTKVERPLLIIAGGLDPVVPIAGITDYVAHLQGAKKPVSFLLDPEEGHMPRKPIARQAYAYLLERLMHHYLGTAAPEAPSKELATYLEQHIKINDALPGA